MDRSAESKADILSQVKQMIQEMRSIPPTDRGIANVDGGSLYDCRVAGTSLRFGPFGNAQDFHKHLRCGMEFHPDLYPRLTNSLLSMRNLTHRLRSHMEISVA